MKTDLVKLMVFVWMSAMLYFTYCMCVDLHYMTDLMHAYMQMVMDHIRR